MGNTIVTQPTITSQITDQLVKDDGVTDVTIKDNAFCIDYKGHHYELRLCYGRSRDIGKICLQIKQIQNSHVCSTQTSGNIGNDPTFFSLKPEFDSKLVKSLDESPDSSDSVTGIVASLKYRMNLRT
jgi:hypothetical protein